MDATPDTTVMDIHKANCHHGHIQCHKQGPFYLSGLWQPLRSYETMAVLGINGIHHFMLPPRLLGGAKGGISTP
jgi:hypothetical protein